MCSISSHKNSFYVYRADNFGEECDFNRSGDCGTIGCALGWLPFISSSEDLQVCSRTDEVDFGELSKRVLGLEEFSQFGKYMFSSNWANNEHEKTRTATIKRIRNVISGLPETELRFP